MLISIGPRSRDEDLVDLLLACHQRIRTFVALAQSVSRATARPEAEIIDACRRCARYFAEALPLHVADEELSLGPRLRGLAGELDDALELMVAEHSEHEPMLTVLLASLHSVERAPSEPALRAPLGEIATRLASEFERHLTAEEQIVFPAIRSRLGPEIQGQILAEFRQRRAPVPA
jgi:iron-sulfur cluster repair protein YtfE (RIC family)